MKKRIGTKIYDTDKGIPVLPEQNLYKQPKNRTFYLFDGEKIEPLTIDQAESIVRESGNLDLLSYLDVKPSRKGCVTVGISYDHFRKLDRYAARNGRPMKSILEEYIDSLEL